MSARWKSAWELPLRTALAATLSTLAYQALGLKHGYWAPISTIIVLQ